MGCRSRETCYGDSTWIAHGYTCLTLSLLDPSQRRVFKPSRRTRPFAATGYELANQAAEASQHASAI